MKKKIIPSTKFKKDQKRYRHNIEKMKKLYDLLVILEETGHVSQEYQPHMLSGNYTHLPPKEPHSPQQKKEPHRFLFLVVNVKVKVRVRVKVRVPVPVNVISPPLCIVH